MFLVLVLILTAYPNSCISLSLFLYSFQMKTILRVWKIMQRVKTRTNAVKDNSRKVERVFKLRLWCTDYWSVYKMHHDQNYLMMGNKRQEESEKKICLKVATSQTLMRPTLTLSMIVTFLFLRTTLSGAAKQIYISIGAICLC